MDKSQKSVDKIRKTGEKQVFVFYNTLKMTRCVTISADIFYVFRQGDSMTQISVQQFVEKYNGSSVDFDKKYGAQCVDLFNFYNSEVVGAPFIGTPATGGARDLYDVESPVRAQYYKKLDANSHLQTGDVTVYGDPNGRYVENGRVIFLGHVRVYIGDGKFIEQNGKIAGKTIVNSDKVGGLLGILRPLRFIGQNSPQNVSPAPQNKNKHIIISGDTFWGLEERYKLAHGTLQQLNPGIDPKALKIGSEIVIAGEPATAPSPAATYYTIQRGDTFWGLEDAWQLPHGTLQQLNPGQDPRKLQIGQRIRRS